MAGVVFNSNVYAWNGKLYKQVGGCPTGLRPSGPVSRVLMDIWVRSMHQKAELSLTLTALNPQLYSRFEIYLMTKYVDDVFLACNIVKPGYKWNFSQGAFQWSLAEDPRSPEARTMEEIAALASSIFQCLNFTWDSPSMNEKKMMPVLDIQLWIGKATKRASIPAAMRLEPEVPPKFKERGKELNVVLFKFYKKPTEGYYLH